MNTKQRVNILLVDDQPGKLMSLEAILGELDENLIKANSADEALKHLLTTEVAVVLVDVCMPQMDGFSLAEMIRAHPRFRKTAILFISAVALTDTDHLKGYDLGAVDYIPVPVVPEVLRAKVAVFIDLFRKTDQLQRLNAELERRVAERTADLEGSNTRLRESEDRYRRLVQALPAALYACDAEGRITLFNHAAAVLWGREPELNKDQWCGSWKTFTPDGEPMDVDQCPMAVTLREGRAVVGKEIVIERPDGTRRNVLPHPDPIFDASGKVIGAINMLMDVTDQRTAESARSHLAAIVESSADAILSKNLDGTITSWNAAAERMFEYTASEAVGKHITMLIPKKRRSEEQEIIARIRRGEVVDHFETVRLAKDGAALQVSLTISPVRDAAGRIVGASNVARDVSDRKKIERALRESEERLRAIFGQAAVGIVLTDCTGRMLEVNERMCQIVGRTSQELCTMTCGALTHPDERAHGERLITELLAGERRETVIEERFARGDGSWVWVSVSVTPLLDEEGRPERLVCIVEDITERKLFREELERQVRERTAELERSNDRVRLSERMATIGTLSAGLGHDMGNLLLPVRMRLDAIESADLPAPVRDDVAAIRSAAEYLQRLAGSLRLLALDPESEATESASTDLADWWNEAEGMVRNGTPQPTMLAGEFPPSLPRVRIGKAGLTQIIFNLVQNAGDALRGRPDGRVVVTAAVTMAGTSVQISVSDNGPGMSDEVRRRCLEPFFTTKTRGLSTGLGLALVSGLIKRAGGTISIRSHPDRGTTVELVLPIAPGPRIDVHGEAVGRGVAVVSLKDRRLLAYVESVLTSMEFEVRRADDPNDADVWVTEATERGEFEAAHRFAGSRPARRAVVIGEQAEGASPGGRVFCLEPRLKLSVLRTRLVGALADVANVAGSGP